MNLEHLNERGGENLKGHTKFVISFSLPHYDGRQKPTGGLHSASSCHQPTRPWKTFDDATVFVVNYDNIRWTTAKKYNNHNNHNGPKDGLLLNRSQTKRWTQNPATWSSAGVTSIIRRWLFNSPESGARSLVVCGLLFSRLTCAIARSVAVWDNN